MSFWDSLKPAKRVPVVIQADLSSDQRAVTLTFDDGHVSTLTGQTLRQACPCAECVEEFSGRRVLDTAKVPDDLKLLELSPVGNYALAFVFGDAHRTGIYNWEYLRAL